MAQPTIYDRQYNFTEYQALHPTVSLPADKVDLELSTVKITLDQTLANLALIQRDDGRLANNSVGADQIKPEIAIGFNPPTTWLTGVNYAVRDYVFVGALMYRCFAGHASGAFATDLAAGKWVLVAQFVGNKVASIDALNVAADQSIYFINATTAQAYSLTSSGRAIAGLTVVGFPAITGVGSAASRTITGTALQIAVANGEGAGGDPVISLPNAISLAGKTIDQGTYSDVVLTGSPTAPTVANTTTNTNIATTAFVKSVRLDQLAAPNASLSLGTQKLTNVVDPTSAQDAATKNYVDGISQGLTPKQSVACATTANISLTGEQTIDGVLTSAARVLVKNQTLSQNNGIYVSAAGAWARALDMDTWLEVPSAYTFVSAGTTQAATGWVCTSVAGGTLGTTAIAFSQFSGAGTYSAGANITLAGTVFSVSPSPSFTTPNLNVATAISINKVAITAPAAGSTLTIADAKTFTVQKTLTFTGTDGQTFTFPVASGAVVTADSTNTLTNKAYDTAGAGNSFSVNGVALTTNNGTGAMVRDNSPSLTTPNLNVATATSINKVAITAPAASATLTIANTKTLTAANTLTFAGTDGTTLTFQGTDTYVGRSTVDTLLNKTLTSPVVNGGALTALTALGVRSTGSGAFDMTVANTENLTAGRTLTVVLNDAARTLNLGGNLVLGGALTTSGAFATTLTATATTNLTLPTAGTLATLAGVETFLNKTLTAPIMTTPTLGVASATSVNKVAITAPATGATLTLADGKTLTVSNSITLAGTDSAVMTMPGATDTLVGLAAVQSITGAKTFVDAKLILAGLTSGAGTLKAPAVASTYVWTLPASTDTLMGKATTDVMTGKTFDTAGAGNNLLINGTAITAVTGTGANVLAVDPALAGNPTAPTQTVGNNSTRVATTAFVTAAVAASTAGVSSLGGATGTITLGSDLAISNNTLTSKGAFNYIINGAMMVSQENGSTAGTSDGYYPVDQFVYLKSHDGTISVAQVASDTPGGSPNRIRATVTATDTSIGSVQYALLRTQIEGLRTADLLFGGAAARTIVFQMGVKAPAGTYCVAIRNGARSYIAEVVVSAGEANTDVVKSVTLPGDTSGTWLKTNGVGIDITLALACGSGLQTPANAWTAGNYHASSNQSNFLATNGNVFELFDVGLYEGSVAPAFKVPDYAETFALCGRYWQIHACFWTGYNTAGGNLDHTFYLPVEMRTAPSAIFSGGYANASGLSAVSLGSTDVILRITVTATGGATVNGSVKLNARL